MLRAVTFDFWGTLYQNSWAREERLRLVGEALAQAGQPRSHEELEEAYGHAWEVFNQLWLVEHRSITWDRWIQEIQGFLGVDLTEETVAGLRLPIEEALLRSDPPRPVPGVPEVLARLAKRFRLGLISDVGLTPGRVMREFLRRDGLLRHFGALTFSDETGMTKPLAEVFRRTLNALNVRPEEAAHVGDLPETDLAGARGVGMQAVLFLGESHREDGRPLADAVFEDYAELEELLGRF
jgi:putative hydrolase of the HAD superfamily